ncbi:MAG TPA: hypothetical protein ENJ08_07350 [Gammaproteobacteria bacterium]|nr:hypothetical protein [Gammaproteobacteria bacterium]
MADSTTRLQGEFIDKSKSYNMEHQHTQHYIPHANQFILLAISNTLSGTMLATDIEQAVKNTY